MLAIQVAQMKGERRVCAHFIVLCSSKLAGAAALNGLNLGNVEGDAAEARGELGEVEEHALGGVDGAELGARGAADAAGGADRLLERTVLLGVVAVGAEGGVAGGAVVAVGAEGLGERAVGGGRVRLGGVVDRGRNGSGTEELDQRRALGVGSSLTKSSCGVHFRNWCDWVVMNRWTDWKRAVACEVVVKRVIFCKVETGRRG
jgi:hypothetical protein